MESYKVFVSTTAKNDLRNIVRCIYSQRNAPITAIQMVDLLEEEMLGLSSLPQQCPLVSDERLYRMGYRKLLVKNYIIFLSINEKEKLVDVERILYARHNWLRLL